MQVRQVLSNSIKKTSLHLRRSPPRWLPSVCHTLLKLLRPAWALLEMGVGLLPYRPATGPEVRHRLTPSRDLKEEATSGWLLSFPEGLLPKVLP